jgi:uncharacterized protein (DUF1501 family)
MKRVNRRTFLKTTAATAAVTLGSPLFAGKKSTAGEDYKAIVCVLLEGGADSFNMVVPKHDISAYDKYKSARGDMALDRDHLRHLTKSEYGFHPNMPRMQRMFNHENLAVIANVGTLNSPISKKEIKLSKKGEGLKDAPYQLFSHVAQRDTWMMAGDSDSGWASRVADELKSDFTNISVGGQNVMQQGGKQKTFVAHDDTFGVIDDPSGVMKKLKRLGVDVNFDADKNVEGKSLGEQLELVAKLIEARESANFPNRQIYFVRYDGWDTHDRAICDSKMGESGGQKIDHLDRSLGAFASALEQLGLEDKVTTFTTSDFGRTIASNDSGADHGWGGHSFAFGGAVNAGFYGQMPSIEKNSPDALINGAVVPTTSVEQYMATLVDWLGDGKMNLDKVFPNLARFDSKILGFMV